MNEMSLLQPDLERSSDSENSQSECISEYAHEIVGEQLTLKNDESLMKT